MSRTSEHDPPAEASDGESVDIPDEGPLDPSVFDGLFGDLGPEADDGNVGGPADDDNPLDEFLTVTLTSEIDARDLDVAAALDADADADEDEGEGEDDRDDTSEEDREPDGSFINADAEVDQAAGGRPVPPSMPTRADELEATDPDSPVERENGLELDRAVELGDLVGDLFADVDDGPGEQLFDDRLAADDTDVDVRDLFEVDEVEVDEVDDIDVEPAGAPFQHEDRPIDRADPIRPLVRLDDGPVRASPEIQQDPRPEPGDRAEPPVEAEPVAPTGGDRTGRSRRLMAALAIAIVVGGSLGVGGAMLLSRLVERDDATPATAAATGAGTEDGGESAAATGAVPPEAAGVPIAELTLASLGFEPGSDSPVLTPSPALDLLSSVVGRDPSQPIVATVRTYTEATAAEDLALSQRQAEALTARLVELGADPDRVAVIGLGRSLLTSAQPVPNFVVPSAGLEPSDLADVARSIGPFAIGIDPATATLRTESMAALDALAAALAADPDGRQLTLAAYSFDRRDRTANEDQARLAASAATAHLAQAGIDPTRVTTIVAGDEPYAVTDRDGNHIDLRWGDAAVGHLALRALAIDAIDFERGSIELGPEAGAAIDRLGALLIDLGGDAVIDVHSFDGDEVQARVDLSVVRAQGIGQRLLAAGVPADRLRLHGGTSTQFESDGRVGRVVVTLLLPPDQS